MASGEWFPKANAKLSIARELPSRLHAAGLAENRLRPLAVPPGGRDLLVFAAGEGYPHRLCALVAHHSAAMLEAEERGLLE